MKFHFLSFAFLASATAFNHPGLLVTDEDITRAKNKIAAQQDPWFSSWNDLISLEFSNASYTNNAVSVVSRDSNGDVLWHDAAAAFDLALRWKISGDEEYAKASAAILTAWAETLESLSGSGDDDYLTAGLQGHELANAAELLRDYSPFVEDGFDAVKSMMTNIFLPMNLDFLNHVLGSEHNVLHFFANWELSNLASAMAIGVLTDNKTTWDFAIDYFKTGSGNGAINNAVTNIVSEPDTGKPLGQGQESGRDQGHSALDIQMFGVVGQQAWNQGEDLFAYNESRILLGTEYFARYNLGYDVPFEPYTNGIVSYTVISSDSRGSIRPTWELIYAHYVQIKGLEAPWTAAYLNNSLAYFGGYEGGAGSWGEGSGHYDGLGWGSLLYHRDSADVAAVSSSTTARALSTTEAAITTTAVSVAEAMSTSAVLSTPVQVSSTATTKVSTTMGQPATFVTITAPRTISTSVSSSYGNSGPHSVTTGIGSSSTGAPSTQTGKPKSAHRKGKSCAAKRPKT